VEKTQEILSSGKKVNNPQDTLSISAEARRAFQVHNSGDVTNLKSEMGTAIEKMDAKDLGVSNEVKSYRNSASRAITLFNDEINRVSLQRSTLGAAQNRLEHTINNLDVARENLTAYETSIRDIDMAAETMSFTKMNILSQSGLAILAQANQMPQQVLQLIGR
jgi:flagellin